MPGLDDFNVPNAPTPPSTLPPGSVLDDFNVIPVIVPPVLGPKPPVLVTATAGNASTLISWTPSITPGVTGYRATATSTGHPDVQATFTSTATQGVIPGLINTATYSVTLVALINVSFSDPSNALTVTPTSTSTNFLPGVPTGLTALARNGAARVSWTAPTISGASAIVDYVVTATSTGPALTYTTKLTTLSIAGLTNALAYSITVVARNSLGAGAKSAAVGVTPLGTAPLAEAPVVYPDGATGPTPPPVPTIPEPLPDAFTVAAPFAPANFIHAGGMKRAGHVQDLALVRTRTVNGVERVVRSLVLSPSFGAVWYTDIDLGTPEIDDAMTPYANTSGVFDETRFTRQRSIAISLTLIDNWFPDIGSSLWHQERNSSAYWVRELSAWAAPSTRGYVYVRFTGEDNPTYRIDVRGAGMAQAIAKEARDLRDVQLNFISPSGVMRLFNQAADAHVDGRTRYVVHFGGNEVEGISAVDTGFLLSPDVNGNLLDFPGVALGSGSGVVYDASLPTGFLARIYAGGQTLKNPRLTFTTYDTDGEQTAAPESIGFQGLTVAAGDFLEIDTTQMTVRYNGDPTETREAYLLGPLRWPQLQPGLNKIDYTVNSDPGGVAVDSPGPDSFTEILYYPAYL